MKRFAIALLFLCGCHAFASVTTETLIVDCKGYVQAQDNGKTTFDNNEQAGQSNRCIGFVAGYMDEAAGELQRDKDNKLSTGNWQNVTADQVIRVFVKYVNANPEALNKAAVFVLWYSAYKAGLYAYTATPANPVEN